MKKVAERAATERGMLYDSPLVALCYRRYNTFPNLLITSSSQSRLKTGLYVLAGPTAVGKTELSIRWAEMYGAEILSCDAFCVYQGMDIGTAKPTAADRARVPHHGIDLVPVTKPFSIADYVEEANRVVAAACKRGVPLLVTGGSGFYLKAFFAPVVDNTPVSDAVREELAALERRRGLDGMVAELKLLNPGGISGIDLQNPRRVRAALERCMASGQPLAVLQENYRNQPPPYGNLPRRLTILTRPREELNQRILQRARAMVADGLIEEVGQLREEGLECNPAAASAIGYRETLKWLEVGGSVESLVEEIARNTCRLVKKQLSFFRNQLPPAREIDLSKAPETVLGELFEGSGPREAKEDPDDC